mmetsp:Transcript_17126/g.32580  ORF Transcript_17126/g.32580 Transcript_17126/m.32580 type:complete len:260 (-) Transcript_17126:140-919(-)|eukprot:CAMPEP_0167795584 /NCGR_PEP_ID=MMETSP0111_2-20121227/14528_1 /TAXON_ID=91324 /ORGANISM="Lotharella globosa, Strain CCCM811" /LENGTH=259 /DNA_ID=CAMNT_0007689291 /DNA_START=50 /DNA_END=829 /DNA_ORIENTATION=-
MPVQSKEAPKDKFSLRLLADTVAAYIAGAAVAPIISAVDRGLAENASGKQALLPSFVNSMKAMVARPVTFFTSPQFFWIWLVYGSTYAAANTCQTICDRRKQDVAIPKLMSTFVVNTTTCIAKDQAFAKMFGTKAAAAVPMQSYAIWLTRDILSMGVFFTLPPIAGKKIAEVTGNERSGYYVAQFFCPLVFQTFLTPVHLLGYDVYNHPNNTIAQRIQFLGKDYWKNVGMRCVRQAPPWSIGTIGNSELRKYFTNKFTA